MIILYQDGRNRAQDKCPAYLRPGASGRAVRAMTGEEMAKFIYYLQFRCTKLLTKREYSDKLALESKECQK